MYLRYGKEIDEKTSLSLDFGNWSYGSGTRTALYGAPCSLQTLLSLLYKLYKANTVHENKCKQIIRYS